MDLNRFDTPCEGCGPDGPASPDTELAPLDLRRHMELMQEYREAIRIVTERFESLGAQARARMQHNPVHSVSSRLKTPTGIMEKLRRKGLALTEESIRLNVRDVAGVRVVCPYLNDIDVVAEFLLSQDDVTLVARKDYVASPKESGYRSLHLVVALSLPLDGLQREVPVEVQVRTIAMDFWASLEHQLRYKNRAVLKDSDPLVEDIRSRLESCARQIARLDRAMQRIQEDIDELPTEQG